MDEGGKRVLLIAASIHATRKLVQFASRHFSLQTGVEMALVVVLGHDLAIEAKSH